MAVIDDFERGNLDPYNNPGGWTVTQSNVYEGSYSARKKDGFGYTSKGELVT